MRKFSTLDIALLPTLGALMFVSKLLTEALPNVHFLALFIIVFTVLFRAKALISIYIFVILTGFYGGFNVWWIPYLYIWLPLWATVMLLPKKMNVKIAVPVYMAVAGLHGLLYGTLYAPFQAIAFGMNFKSTVAWIIAGLPWDAIHGISNFCIASLSVPIISVMKKVINH